MIHTDSRINTDPFAYIQQFCIHNTDLKQWCNAALHIHNTDLKQWCNVALHIHNTDELTHSEHMCMQCCTNKLQNWCAAPKVITNQLQNNSFVSALIWSIGNLFAASKLKTDFQNTILSSQECSSAFFFNKYRTQFSILSSQNRHSFNKT